MWKNIVERGRPQITIWCMHIACRIPKATNIHTLRLCNSYCFSTATMVARTLRYTYIVCLVMMITQWGCFALRQHNSYRCWILSCTIKTKEIWFCSIDIITWNTIYNTQSRDSVVRMVILLGAGRSGVQICCIWSFEDESETRWKHIVIY
jgi:hypothetical protein